MSEYTPQLEQSTNETQSTSFADESSLQRYLLERTLATSGSRYCWARREMPIGNRIPDVVMVSFQQAPPYERWPRRFSFRYAAVMAVLRNRPNVTIDTVARRCFDRVDRIAEIVSDLLRAGTIEEGRPGVLRLSPAVTELQVDVTAIEAKLTRWSEALTQARSYMGFADDVFVALDTSLVISNKVLEAFRASGVGLWKTSQECLTPILPACRRSSWTAEKEYVVASVMVGRSSTLWKLAP